MSDLAKRLLTAVVLIPAVVAALFFDPTPYSIAVLAALAIVLAGDEWLRMAMVSEDDPAWLVRVALGASGAALVGLTVAFGVNEALAPTLTGSAVVLATSVLMRKKALPNAGRHMAFALAGLIYVPVLACVWPLLKIDFGPEWLFLAMAATFCSDSFAYFAGRALGKHKLYEAVSPKKTIEGSVGGLVGGAAACVGFGHFWLTPELPLVHAIVLGLGSSVLGQIGDLVESMLKRTFGVKDSGNVLPGHGGMLDRVDALLFVAPLIYYYALLTGR